MPFGIQPLHILIIVLVALLIFGPKRLPEIGRYIGRTITEFRQGTQDLTETLREEINKPLPPTASSQDTHDATASSPASGGNYCTQCGASNNATARFCGNCGNRLGEETA